MSDPRPTPASRSTRRSLPALLPEPVRSDPRPGALQLVDGAIVGLPGRPSARLLVAAERFIARVQGRAGLRLELEVSGRASRDRLLGGWVEEPASQEALAADPLAAAIELALDPDVAIDPSKETAREAYALSIEPFGARLRARDEAGLAHGLATLAQLVDARGRLPACSIEDQPALPHRGVMLDVSRGKVPTIETLKALVERCADLKLNVLMLYTEHVFRFRRHPEIGADASPMSARQLLDLDRFARDRGVELVPCLQSLGHMKHVLKLPRYAGLAESEIGWTIAPTAEGTYPLLADLYDEYLPLFSSPRFNANCDEPFDLAKGRSKAREEELGPGGVFVEHVRRLHTMTAAHDKRLMIWGDVVHAHPERIPELPADTIMLDWWYEAEFDFDRVARFAEHGFEFWVCPGTASWNCLFPRVENSLKNIERWAAAGRRHGASGLLNTDWGDGGHYNLQGLSLFGYAFGAQQAWSGPVDRKRFDRAFSRELFGDGKGEIARIHHALGAIHDAGFLMFNGSALQYLYFDDLASAVFLKSSKPGLLRRHLPKLEKLCARIAALDREAAPDAFVRLAVDELAWAADATRLAVVKGLAALESIAWRRDPTSLAARERRALARRLRTIADEQRAQGRRLRKLWLARSEPSNLEITEARLSASIRGLRNDARALERGRPIEPPAEGEVTRADMIAAVRKAIGL